MSSYQLPTRQDSFQIPASSRIGGPSEGGLGIHLTEMSEDYSRPSTTLSSNTSEFAFLKPPRKTSDRVEEDFSTNARKRQSLYAKGQSLFSRRPSIFAKGQSLYSKRQSIYAKGQSLYARTQSIYGGNRNSTYGSNRRSTYGGNRQSIYARKGSMATKRQSLYPYIETAFSAVNPFAYRNRPDLVNVQAPKHHKSRRANAGWYSSLSTRSVILLYASLVIAGLLTVGLSVGLVQDAKGGKSEAPAPWRPAIGTTWQIQLSHPVTNPSRRAFVYDIDLFDNNEAIIAHLHSMGRRVICHFSAGIYESSRPDAAKFTEEMLGGNVTGLDGARWLDIRLKSVREIMADRIDLAQQKGCDGIDPDDVNGYTSNMTSFPLTVSDSVKYVRYLAKQALSKMLSMGLNNSPELVQGTIDVVDWGMNESCAQDGDCEKYQAFIQAGRPVFHIEYLTGTVVQALSQACNATGINSYSTLIKRPELDVWSSECLLG